MSCRPQVTQGVFPVIKAIFHAAIITSDCFAPAESVVISEISSSEPRYDNLELDSETFQEVDWSYEQDQNPDISVIRALVQKGEKPKGEIARSVYDEVQGYFQNLKSLIMCCTECPLLMEVWSNNVTTTTFRGLHVDIGHQGRDKTL